MIGYPSGQDGAAWDYLPCPQEKFPESHIINPLFTKLVRARWLDIGLFLFFASLTLSRSINMQKKANIQPSRLHAILVPRAYDPSGLWLGSRALAGSNFLSIRRVSVSYSQPIRFARFDMNHTLPALDKRELSIPDTGQKDRGLWGREWTSHLVNNQYTSIICSRATCMPAKPK